VLRDIGWVMSHVSLQCLVIVFRVDLDVRESSTDSVGWLSAPQIAIQAASPLTQSSASEDESAEEFSAVPRTPDHVENQDKDDKSGTSNFPGWEMLHDSNRKDSEDREEEEPVEGRLSTDTSEQIFISQQIEAKSSSDQRQPDVILDSEQSLLQESLPPDDLPDTSTAGPPSSSDIDRLQSPEKTSTGSDSFTALYSALP